MNQTRQKRHSWSPISVLHGYKLVFRTALFLAMLAYCVFFHPSNPAEVFNNPWTAPVILGVVWIFFVVEMILRFFPSSLESMGCQKQFSRNYKPVGPKKLPYDQNHGVPLVILSWVALNAVIGVLYYTDIIDAYVLILISLAYSICDMICILFFCPFQTWMMKNKCCCTCRIYNWDYAMMFTPLIFVPSWYTWSLLGLAVLLLVTWELFHWRHPERFSESTNGALYCANCPEKLCHHKTQLHRFWTREKQRLQKHLKKPPEPEI